ncbi:MAG: EamA family transporter [Oscillospiraceae bacterium]|nr:EamA family transporter [Oscillospiraceae bacterium]
MWLIFALLGAIFAALTAIFAKIGLDNVDTNLATAIRTIVVLLIAWGVVFITGKQGEITAITQKSWLFLILSGCATGISWLFYFRAMQLGSVSKVVPVDKLSVVITMVLAFVILRETVDVKAIIGGVLIGAGTLILVI